MGDLIAMDRSDALAVLSLSEGTSARAVRERYLELLRAWHPDATRRATDGVAARITEAYRVLRTSAPTVDAVRAVAAGDTLEIAAPPEEAFFALLDVASTIGEVTYVDPEVGMLEVVVVLSTGATCSLVVTLQGRGTGVTEAFCTVEDLGPRHAPPVEALVLELADLLGVSLNL